MKSISATNANRQFSALLREVEKGTPFEIMSRGRRVAVMTPAAAEAAASETAKTRLLQRLKSQSIEALQTWKRDDLYDV